MGTDSPVRLRLFFLAAAALSLWVALPVLLPLGLGAVLGFLSERPLYSLWWRRRITSRAMRYATAAAFLSLISLGLLLPLVLTLAFGLRDIAVFLQHANLDIPELGGQLWRGLLSRISEPLRGWGVEISSGDITERLRPGIIWLGRQLGNAAGVLIAETPGAIFGVVVTLLAWLEMAVDGHRARKSLLSLLIPWERERLVIARTTAGVIRSLFLANTMVSLVQAAISGMVLAAVGFPRASSLGILAFFASFLPLFGTALILIPAGLWFGLNGHPVGGVVIASTALVVGLLDNFLRPLFMRGSVELGFFWILVAFVGGLAGFGVAGAIVGPLAFSLFLAFWRMLSGRFHTVSETPLRAPISDAGGESTAGVSQ